MEAVFSVGDDGQSGEITGFRGRREMKFSCVHCGQRYEIDDRFAGQSTSCQTCGNMMKIPVPIDKIEVRNEVLQLSGSEIERRIRRRRRQRRLRRIIIAVAALLLGMVCGAIAMIVMETRNPGLYSDITEKLAAEPAAPTPAP